jgi:hypothetical protein
MEESDACEQQGASRPRRHYHEALADGLVIYAGYDWYEAIGAYFAAARQTGAHHIIRRTNGLPVVRLHIPI